MPVPLRSIALPFVGLLGACFPPPLQDCTDTGCTAPMTGTTNDPAVPTTGASVDPVQTVTGGDESTSTTGGSSGSSGAMSDALPEVPPAIIDVVLDPNPIAKNGLIAVDVEAEHADGVRMQLKDGDVIELAPGGSGSFHGQIPAFTGLDNGMHNAALTPWRDVLDGREVDAPYTIALPEPGSQGFWETGDLIGGGNVAALDVLPDGSVVELGTYFDNGVPRCYLRRRDRNGAWFLEDFVSLLPNSQCTAIDLKIDRELGTLYVLTSRKGGDGLRWWLGEIPSWGQGVKQIGVGAVGDKAEALARGPGLLAVCGGKQAPTLDLDAAAWLHRPNQPVQPLLFDYWPKDAAFDHQFNETARDCTFAAETLVLVGEANGKHSKLANEIERDRLFIVEHNTSAGTASWTVAGPGPGTQSRALAIDMDNEGRYLLAGYTCGDICEPDGEVRIYLPGGEQGWQASLGPLGSDGVGPHDIAWSPAGYLVVALAEFDGQALRFKVQAIAPHVYKPLWTFVPADMQGLQVALALAIGKFGEIYAGGLGAGNYPAFAIIPG